MKDELYPEIFTDEYKIKLLKLIKDSTEGNTASFSNSDFIILMHWKHHENDSAYSFVPKECRGYK